MVGVSLVNLLVVRMSCAIAGGLTRVREDSDEWSSVVGMMVIERRLGIVLAK